MIAEMDLKAAKLCVANIPDTDKARNEFDAQLPVWV